MPFLETGGGRGVREGRDFHGKTETGTVKTEPQLRRGQIILIPCSGTGELGKNPSDLFVLKNDIDNLESFSTFRTPKRVSLSSSQF